MYYDQVEVLPREELHALQDERLRQMVHTVYERVPFYRDLFDREGIQPADIHSIEELPRLSFTKKQDLKNAYPLGMLAVPREQLAVVIGNVRHTLSVLPADPFRLLKRRERAEAMQQPRRVGVDDHSRVIVGARLYERETLLAHLEFVSSIFQACGLPLCLYVDYHSFFFTHTPEAHTQFAAALRFYGVSLRFAPTPQAKGKIERGHQFWQGRLPSLFAAEDITELAQANSLLDQLRKHHNQMEKHREIGCCPQEAWDVARKEDRWALGPAPRCPWWPYVFTQRTRVTVGSDGKLAIGSQRLSVDVAPGTKVIRCLHPNGDVTVLRHPPEHGVLPVILLSTRLC